MRLTIFEGKKIVAAVIRVVFLLFDNSKSHNIEVNFVELDEYIFNEFLFASPIKMTELAYKNTHSNTLLS